MARNFFCSVNFPPNINHLLLDKFPLLHPLYKYCFLLSSSSPPLPCWVTEVDCCIAMLYGITHYRGRERLSSSDRLSHPSFTSASDDAISINSEFSAPCSMPLWCHQCSLVIAIKASAFEDEVRYWCSVKEKCEDIPPKITYTLHLTPTQG